MTKLQEKLNERRAEIGKGSKVETIKKVLLDYGFVQENDVLVIPDKEKINFKYSNNEDKYKPGFFKVNFFKNCIEVSFYSTQRQIDLPYPVKGYDACSAEVHDHYNNIDYVDCGYLFVEWYYESLDTEKVVETIIAVFEKYIVPDILSFND